MAARKTPRKRGPRYVTMGPVVAAFIEAAVIQTQGEWSGEPLTLEQWQKDFLNEAFLVHADGPRAGLRVYRTAGLYLPTKNGKSTLASGLQAYGLLADGPLGGELEGKPQVYAAANSKEQSRVVFNEFRDGARMSPFLAARLKIGEHSIQPKGRLGICRPLSAEGRTIHGFNPSFSVIDEIGQARDGQILTIVQKSRTARRQPFTVIISHVGVERYGPLGDMYDRFRKHPKLEVYGKKKGEPLLQIVRDREAGQLFWWYGMQDGYDPEDPAVWMKCNPASWQTIETLQAQRDDYSLTWTEFQRYHLNAFTASEDEFLPAGAFAACADEEMVIPRGAPVWLGIDAAKKNDCGAVVIAHPQLVPSADGKTQEVHVKLLAHILEADGSDDSMLERIEELVRKVGRRYQVREVHYDPWSFPRSADLLADDGFEMIEFPQTDVRMIPATKLFRQMVLERRVTHDGDPVLTRHVGSAVVKETERGIRVHKGKARHKMDGCAAAIMAVAAVQKAVARGDFGKRRGIQIVGLG